MRATVAIVTRGMSPEVEALTARIRQITAGGPVCDVLVVAEDAAVESPTEPVEVAEDVRLVRIPRGRGLGYNRNRALDFCEGDVVVFTDDDCWPADDWLGELLEPLAHGEIAAVMGNTHIPPSTFLGDSISALGFPGGGSVGFEVMFGVDEDGFTEHLSTLNCAIRTSVFSQVGGFDETMSFGGEDGELSYRICAADLKIAFQPSALVDHAPRTTLKGFARWFFRRGRAARQYALRASAGRRVGRRLASYRTIVSTHLTDPKILAIVPLLVASVILQQSGFVWETAFGASTRSAAAAREQ